MHPLLRLINNDPFVFESIPGDHELVYKLVSETHDETLHHINSLLKMYPTVFFS